MRYLGLDLGTKTLGIAISDQTGTIANSYKTIHFKEDNYDQIFKLLNEIVAKYNIDKIVIGFPKNMDNTLGVAALKVLDFKKQLEQYLPKEIILEDERWTTKQTEKLLINADLSRKKRKKVVDKLAATIILQSYLDKINRKE